jgi:hypothetical protein
MLDITVSRVSYLVHMSGAFFRHHLPAYHIRCIFPVHFSCIIYRRIISSAYFRCIYLVHFSSIIYRRIISGAYSQCIFPASFTVVSYPVHFSGIIYRRIISGAFVLPASFTGVSYLAHLSSGIIHRIQNSHPGMYMCRLKYQYGYLQIRYGIHRFKGPREPRSSGTVYLFLESDGPVNVVPLPDT